MQPRGGHEQLSDESTAVAWLTPDEVMTRMSEAYSVRIADALTDDLAPRVRTRDGRKLTNRAGS
jgi:hypothetical protein